MSRFVIVSDFCLKNFFDKECNKSISTQWVCDQVQKYFKKAKRGYRDGVLIVPIPPRKFFSPVVKLKKDSVLMGKFCQRMDNEECRKKIGIPNIPLVRAKYCDVVLYSREVLQETKENTLNPSMLRVGGPAEFSDWEIITILPRLDAAQPMPVETLLYNHFQQSGGTKTNMTNDEFVEELKKSFLYWKDKAMVWK
jgi:hypothetical protein